MNIAQRNVLVNLKRDILAHDRHGENYEYKRWDINDNQTHVYLIATVGMKKDEGTMAEVFARTTRHICIGPNGGTKLLNTGKYRNSKIHRVKTHAEGYNHVLYSLTAD